MSVEQNKSSFNFDTESLLISISKNDASNILKNAGFEDTDEYSISFLRSITEASALVNQRTLVSFLNCFIDFHKNFENSEKNIFVENMNENIQLFLKEHNIQKEIFIKAELEKEKNNMKYVKRSFYLVVIVSFFAVFSFIGLLYFSSKSAFKEFSLQSKEQELQKEKKRWEVLKKTCMLQNKFYGTFLQDLDNMENGEFEIKIKELNKKLK